MSIASAAPATTGPRVGAATRATSVAFVSCGFAMASWASRIPQLRDRLQLSPADLGLVLLSIAAGPIAALLLAGMIVSRFHSRPTVAVMAVLHGAALATVAAGYLVGVTPVVAGLVVFGFSAGAWDVAMNGHRPRGRRTHGAARETAGALRRWREPRTLLVGIVVLAFAFAEGAGIDWISLALIDSYHQPAVVGTIGFAVFLAAMTAGRWFADPCSPGTAG